MNVKSSGGGYVRIKCKFCAYGYWPTVDIDERSLRVD